MRVRATGIWQEARQSALLALPTFILLAFRWTAPPLLAPRNMPPLTSLRLSALLMVAVTVNACARKEAAPAAQTSSASGGDVTASPVIASQSGKPADSVSTLADKGRIRGAETAPIWLVEISDFQCPYCKRWHDESYAILDKEFVQTGKVRLAFLNFPIPSLHPNARAAAEAAMCASVQGKFWELHESLFNSQKSWAPKKDPMPMFDSLAVAAGADGPRWRSCMSSHSAVPIIDADRQRLSSTGVQSTPTFFIGDQKLEGAYPADSFRVIIRKQIDKAGAGR